MQIRFEEPRDYPAVYAVNATAFETPSEAKLVEALRMEVKPTISLVAEVSGKIVGHILFSPVSLSGHPELSIMGLGPMAVSPAYQREGIGSALVQAGLVECKREGFGAVAVLGHPGFYPRFGFIASSKFGIRCEFDVPEDVFMVMELSPGYLQGASGVIKYHPEFNNV